MDQLADNIEKACELFVDNEIFAFHDKGIPDTVLTDPYRFLDQQVERHGHVFLAENNLLGGINIAQPFNLPGPVYCVFGYDAVDEVLRKPQIFNQGYDSSMALVMGRVPPTLDPPEHTGYRGLINKSFGKFAVETIKERVLDPAARLLIDRFEQKSHAELVTDYSAILPFIVIANLLDLPSDRFGAFAEQVRDLLAFGYDPERAMAAVFAMNSYFGEVVAERTDAPGDDLISALAAAELDGERLSRDDVVSFCKLLTPAGMETTTKTLGNILNGLLTDRRQWELLLADPSLIASAVDEGLRWEGPAIFMPKRATEDYELRGVRIPRGAYVMVFHGHAGHDPLRWDRPHEFDITRSKRSHLAFSVGPHTCVGNQLARREMEIGLAVLLERLPQLRLDPDRPAPKVMGFMMRSTERIDVVLPKLH